MSEINQELQLYNGEEHSFGCSQPVKRPRYSDQPSETIAFKDHIVRRSWHHLTPANMVSLSGIIAVVETAVGTAACSSICEAPLSYSFATTACSAAFDAIAIPLAVNLIPAISKTKARNMNSLFLMTAATACLAGVAQAPIMSMIYNKTLGRGSIATQNQRILKETPQETFRQSIADSVVKGNTLVITGLPIAAL